MVLKARYFTHYLLSDVHNLQSPYITETGKSSPPNNVTKPPRQAFTRTAWIHIQQHITSPPQPRTRLPPASHFHPVPVQYCNRHQPSRDPHPLTLASIPDTSRIQPLRHKNHIPPRPLLTGHLIKQDDINGADVQGSVVRRFCLSLGGGGMEMAVWWGFAFVTAFIDSLST